MRAVIQRVSSASVTVDGKVTGKIGNGLLVYLGVGGEDTQQSAERLIQKIINLRIFNDEAGKMNLSLLEVGGSVLLISQFTLYADIRKGRRPSFTDAAPLEKGKTIYEFVLKRLAELGVSGQAGVFQAHMDVASVNDGPVTISIDSNDLPIAS